MAKIHAYGLCARSDEATVADPLTRVSAGAYVGFYRINYEVYRPNNGRKWAFAFQFNGERIESPAWYKNRAEAEADCREAIDGNIAAEDARQLAAERAAMVAPAVPAGWDSAETESDAATVVEPESDPVRIIAEPSKHGPRFPADTYVVQFQWRDRSGYTSGEFAMWYCDGAMLHFVFSNPDYKTILDRCRSRAVMFCPTLA